MTLNFMAKRRMTAGCAHDHQMRIEVAGMSREVCESCGRVSVAYVGDHFQKDLDQIPSDTTSDEDVSTD